ncbi:MAG TPA: hypothetical protein VIH86_05630 [Puia sp.]
MIGCILFTIFILLALTLFIIYIAHTANILLIFVSCILSLISGALIIFCILTYTCFNKGVIFDIFGIIFGAIAIIFVGCCSWKKKRWEGKKAWIPVALIIAAGAVAFALVELNLEEGGLLIKKITICHCEVCLSQKIQKEISCLCGLYDPLDKTGYAIMPDGWQTKYYDKAKAEIAKKTDDLLKLCCAQTSNQFLKELNNIQRRKLEEINNNSLNKEQLDEKIAEFVIIDALALCAFQQAVEQCLSSSCPNGKHND